MNSWKPITREEFQQLFESQYSDLGSGQRARFDQYRVDFWLATIRRSDEARDEHVFVVAQKDDGVLYFDDVEYGFNISHIDEAGRILTPGGSQASLHEAVDQWFPKTQY